MASPELFQTKLFCPREGCGRALMRDECGVFCQGCGHEAVTWADPVDADVPMDVILEREHRAGRMRLLRRGLAAAALLVALGAGAWALWPAEKIAAASEGSRTAELSMNSLRESFARGVPPEGLRLPACYGDPDLLLLPKSREAQSDLVIHWQALTEEQKIELLEMVKQVDSLALLPYVAEIAWFTLAAEPSVAVSRSTLDALYLGSRRHLDLVEFLVRHVAAVTPHAEVRTDATDFGAALAQRRARLGR